MFIQIAGIHDFEEAKMLVDSGVTHIGFPFRLPVHQEDISEQNAKIIIQSIPKRINSVLITYLDNANEIIELSNYLGTKMVQIHTDITVSEINQLVKRAPRLSIIKSLVVKENNLNVLQNTIKELEPLVDYFITDTFDPDTGASGATGKTHNWEISKEVIRLSNKPIILAGGLNPKNVTKAIIQVKPYGVDVHTGVEDNTGRKNLSLVKEFVKQTQEGFRTIGIV
jgi:phosphoribosylanthranilate isomerase